MVNASSGLSRLRVSSSGRFLVRGDGTPFFYLADTAWELLRRLSLEEAAEYLRDRAAKGFSVIQCVAFTEFAPKADVNVYGHTTFEDNDPRRPNEQFFQHVDHVVRQANDLGLYVGLLPTWGDKVGPRAWGGGPERFFDPTSARLYGQFLGQRYRDSNMIWILGGDRPCEGFGFKETWRAMAQGLREGDGGRGLITYHPKGGEHSSWWLHDEPWLDFNMIQSGHARNVPNYKMILSDYTRRPVKPVLDGEAVYEDHPVQGNGEIYGWASGFDVRRAAYMSVFAGACGHTYGCHGVWQFWAPPAQPLMPCRTPWRTALDLPGAQHMRHLRALMQSRPYLTRIPDQSCLVEPWGDLMSHVPVTRDGTAGRNDATYLMAYFAVHKEVVLQTAFIGGQTLQAWWYDPRSGQAHSSGTFANAGRHRFAPPCHVRAEEDWVLVLDDAARGYAPPGQARQ